MTAGAAAAPRPRRLARVRRWAARRLAVDAVPLALLALWFVAADRTPRYILPHPADVAELSVRLFIDPDYAGHTYRSVARVAVSVLLSVAIGTAVMVLPRLLPLTSGFIGGRLLPALNAFPTLTWAMMAVYWFGVTDRSVIFVEVAILLPFTMVTMGEGLKALDPDLLEMARSFSRSRAAVLRKVVLPMLVPYGLTSLRIAYGVAWKVALIAELFGATAGLGYLLNYHRQLLDTAMLFAITVDIVVLVYALDLAFGAVERRALRYRRADPPGGA